MNRTDRLLAIVLELQRHRIQRAEDLAATFTGGAIEFDRSHVVLVLLVVGERRQGHEAPGSPRGLSAPWYQPFTQTTCFSV